MLASDRPQKCELAVRSQEVLGWIVRTCKTVGDSDILSIILSEQYTDDSLPCALGRSVVVIDDGKKDEGGNGDVSRDKRESLGGGGGHRGDPSVCVLIPRWVKGCSKKRT